MGVISEELIQLYNSGEYPMHMPGHKRQDTGSPLDSTYHMDITEITGYDNLYDAHGILREGMDYAAGLYDCPHTYYLVNGSTIGVLIAIHTVAEMYGKQPGKRSRILVASGCHRSVWAGAELAHLKADIIDTEYIDIPHELNVHTEKPDTGHNTDSIDKNRGSAVHIRAGISPASLEKSLSEAKAAGEGYAAVIITSPTYEGIISDVEAIANVCHRYDTVLIVDEAHGAHLDLSDEYPGGALRYGADIVIHSTHKTLAAMTQTALLHAQGALVDITILEKYWTRLQTSSPSYVLMASIDNALHHITENPDLVRKHTDMVRDMRAKLGAKADSAGGLKVLGLLTPDDLRSCDTAVALDPCKIVVFTGSSGIDGYTLQKILLDEYHIQTEMATDDYVLGITTYMDTEEGIVRFIDGILKTDEELCRGGHENYRHSVTEGATDTPRNVSNPLYAPCIPDR